METKTIIKSLNHEDIVNLLATASYGSYIIGLDYDSDEYESLPNADDEDCIEDKMAKLLLAGKSVVLADMYAEDENDYYGNLPHHWNEEDWRYPVMEYIVNLKDITDGLQRASELGDFARECLNDFIEDSNNFDQPRAEELVQTIMFGKPIYG